MDPQAYHEFTHQLIANLAARPEVLGLVAVGSMAAQDTQPDAWSDHDFYVVVQPGAQARFRQVYDWLPDGQEIAWAFPDTEHGVKVVYRTGHLLEYAVFDEQELYLAKSNRYRVLLDRSRLADQMAEIAANTTNWAALSPDVAHAGQFLTNMLVGIGRYQRGERLSAHHLVKSGALHHLLALLQRHAPSGDGNHADNIDPLRRFESTQPELGAQLEGILLQPVPQAAFGLLALYQRWLAAELPEVPQAMLEVLERRIADSQEETEVIATEQRWVRAHHTLDLAEIDALLDPEYLHVNPDGSVNGKAELLASYGSGERYWEIAASDQYQVRILGATALLFGRWRGRGLNRGQPFDYSARFLAVYRRRPGGWKLAGDLSLPLSESDRSAPEKDS